VTSLARAFALAFIATCFVLSPWGFAPASMVETTRPAFSLEAVLALTREKAPAIAAAQARVTQADGERFRAAVLPDPEVELAAGRGEPRDGAGSGRFESAFAISQFVPWATGERKRAGAASTQASRYEVEDVTAEVMLEARSRYYVAAIENTRALALRQSAQDAQSLQDVVARRVEAGEAAEGDRLRTRVEALRTELEARAADAEASGARASLNRFLLGALGSDFTLSTDLDPRRLPPTPDDLIDSALSRNPAYLASLSRVDAAKLVASAESASRIPGVNLSLYGLQELDRQAVGAAFGFSIPLWNRNQGAIRTARGRLAEAESEALGLRARIEGEIERLVRKDRVARDLAVTYRQDIIPAATEALSITRFSLEQGEANLLSWLEARRSYLETLRSSYAAQLEAFLTRAELERLTGEIDVPDHR
jgi:cobalt-zinc-cadmium efflux system outer membrane protein